MGGNASAAHAAEVIVVGAGPAGSVTAALLAQRGRDVLLLDRCQFPRDKPCGECINPAGTAILRDLGVLDILPAAASRPLRGLLLRGPDGEAVALDYPGDPSPQAVSVQRRDLDLALVQNAVAAGARFVPGCVVEDVLQGDDAVTGVVCRAGAPLPRQLRARLVVAADGSHSRLARRTGLHRSADERRIALVGHFRQVASDLEQVEMHTLGWGYCGYALHRPGEATAAMVVRESELPALQGRAEAFFTERLRHFTHIHARVRDADLVAPPRVMCPVSSRTALASRPGLLLVGDAAGFFDPFTGRGITRALRGARFAAAAAEQLLQGAPLRPTLRRYAAEIRGIDSAHLVERAIRFCIDRPRLLSHAVRRFQQHPDLGRALLGVAGDLSPASDVLNTQYLLRLLFRLPAPLASSNDRSNDEGAPWRVPLTKSNP